MSLQSRTQSAVAHETTEASTRPSGWPGCAARPWPALLLCVAGAVTIASTACTPAEKYGPETSSTLERGEFDPPLDREKLAVILARLRNLDPDALADLEDDELPPAAPDTQVRTWHRLRDLGGEVKKLADARYEPGAAVKLRLAVLDLEEGAEGLRTLDLGRPRALTAMRRAATELAGAVRSGEIDERTGDETLARLVSIARDVAVEVHGMLARGGAGPTLLREVEGHLVRSSELVAAGNFPGALEPLSKIVAQESNLSFSMDAFEDNIRDAFEDETVGFAYAIARNGLLARADGVGLARTSTDDSEIEQSQHFRMNIASVSKTVTATAVLRLLQMKGLTPDSFVSPYLPPDWEMGPGIATLSFRDLLTHHTGFCRQNESWDYATLQSYIEAGIDFDDKEDYCYQNTNFALFRVLIPHLWGLADDFPDLPPDQVTAGLYIFFVQWYVLEPMGIDGANCAEGDPDLRYYPFPAGNTPGIQQADWTLWSGSSGWYLSAVELVRFMAYRRYDTSILVPGVRLAMDLGFLGWNNPVDWDWGYGLHGIYRNHGGDINLLDTCIMEYPNGVQAAVIINSTGGSYPYQCVALRNSFDDAWIFAETI